MQIFLNTSTFLTPSGQLPNRKLDSGQYVPSCGCWDIHPLGGVVTLPLQSISSFSIAWCHPFLTSPSQPQLNSLPELYKSPSLINSGHLLSLSQPPTSKSK